MKKHIFKIALLAIVSLLSISCGGGDSASPEPDTPPVTPPETPVDNTFPTPQWESDVRIIENKYEGSMAVCLSLDEPLLAASASTDQLAVFCGSECRGVAYREDLGGGKYVWIAMVHGEDGDVLTFKYYAAATRFMYTTTATATFTKDTQYGNVDNPVIVPFTQVTK